VYFENKNTFFKSICPSLEIVSFGDPRLIEIYQHSTHWHLGPVGGEQHVERHRKATQTVEVVRR